MSTNHVISFMDAAKLLQREAKPNNEYTTVRASIVGESGGRFPSFVDSAIENLVNAVENNINTDMHGMDRHDMIADIVEAIGHAYLDGDD